MKIPETVRLSQRSQECIAEATDAVQGHADARGLLVGDVTASELVGLALEHLSATARSEPEVLAGELVDRRYLEGKE